MPSKYLEMARLVNNFSKASNPPDEPRNSTITSHNLFENLPRQFHITAEQANNSPSVGGQFELIFQQLYL